MRRVAFACGAVVALWALLAAPVASADDHESPAGQAEETATTTPIKHFVYLMQEGHSFDEYFGTFPGADGMPDDACMPRDVNDPSQGCVERSPRGDQPPVEIRHESAVQLAQIDGGRMDGFVSAVRDDPASAGVGHAVLRRLRAALVLERRRAVRAASIGSSRRRPEDTSPTTCSGWPGPEGRPRPRTTIPPGGWGDGIPTVFDRLEAAGISWKVYVQGYALAQDDAASGAATPASASALAARVPLLEMPRFAHDPRLSSRIVDLSQYYDDLQQGSFPSVAFVVPSGASSEHPPASVRAGQMFVRGLVNELMRSSAWDSSAFLLSYDDTGGAYDHVPPPPAGPDGVEFGLRVPALLVSPYARHGAIDHTTLDATSGLGLHPRELGHRSRDQPRDASAPSFATAFDFAPAPRPLARARVRHPRRSAASVGRRQLPSTPPTGWRCLIPLGIGVATGLRIRKERRSP